MAKLRMTNADYLAIAVSPALVMALVGSLVFFLIEVLYVGEYSLRLNYVFALFVFATVLISRIAIEMGAELAAMYSLPLGLLTWLALERFVEHPGPLGWLINLGLLAVVWWCSHKLTWDSTVIDDNEDSSGEGLLGRIGVDESEQRGVDAPAATDNELLADDAAAAEAPWWKRIFRTRQGPHTPGLWVLYFSLAALPLFGVGQHWIPSADVARRRYAFGLLCAYVAAALSLLLTTSFLGLRRYLRRRRVEMPAPMAATWVALGAVLIVLVMFAAALLPRPKAEYALARVPWQAGSPGDNSANRVSIGEEGTIDPAAEDRVTSDNQREAPPGDEVRTEGQEPLDADHGQSQQQAEAGPQRQQGRPVESTRSESTSNESTNGEGTANDSGSSNAPSDGQPAEQPSEDSQQSSESGSSSPRSDASQPPSSSPPSPQRQQGPQDSETANSAARRMFAHPRGAFQPPQVLQAVTSSLANLLKLILYALLALAILYLAWRYRAEIARALGEILQQLRSFWARLFGLREAAVAGEEGASAAAAPRRRTFSEFADPFLSGRHVSTSPQELVRYTFDAFEAWAGDHGRQRTPDQTPQELLRGAVSPHSPLYEPASHLIRLYSEAAYAARPIDRQAAGRLRELWRLMHAPSPLGRSEVEAPR